MSRIGTVVLAVAFSLAASGALAQETVLLLRSGKTFKADQDYYLFTASAAERLVSAAERLKGAEELAESLKAKVTLLEETDRVNSRLAEALVKNRDVYESLWKKAEEDNKALVRKARRSIWRDAAILGALKWIFENVKIK